MRSTIALPWVSINWSMQWHVQPTDKKKKGIYNQNRVKFGGSKFSWGCAAYEWIKIKKNTGPK